MSTPVDSKNKGHEQTHPTESAVANNAATKTLCREQAELALMKLKHYTALVVWRSMLREAKLKQSWQIYRTIAAIKDETCLSKATILKAQKDLVSLGYATILSGGRGSRQDDYVLPDTHHRRHTRSVKKVTLSNVCPFRSH